MTAASKWYCPSFESLTAGKSRRQHHGHYQHRAPAGPHSAVPGGEGEAGRAGEVRG